MIECYLKKLGLIRYKMVPSDHSHTIVQITFRMSHLPVSYCPGMVIITPPTIKVAKQASTMIDNNILINDPIKIGNALSGLTVVVLPSAL